MSDQNKRKKEKEEKVLREFLGAIGWKVVSITSGECPDFKATISNGTQNLSVGIELTENLPPEEGSPGRNLQAVCETLEKHCRNFQPMYPNLAKHLEVDVNFNTGSAPKKAITEKLGQELLEFLSNNISELLANPRSFRRLIVSQKNKFPLVWKHIGSLHFWRHDFEEPMALSCPLADGAWITLVSEKLVNIIDYKAEKKEIDNKAQEKGKKYDRKDIDELWLLIFGGGGISVHSAFAKVEKAITQEVVQSLKKSGFQRVYMWEQFMRQAYELWPRSQ